LKKKKKSLRGVPKKRNPTKARQGFVGGKGEPKKGHQWESQPALLGGDTADKEP